MSGNSRFVRHALLGGAVLCALNVQAAETLPVPSKISSAELCLKSLGMQEVQPIKQMAKELSPEVVLDRIFSAIAPDFQKALLSKPTDAASPVDGAEAMRDPKFFLPAIATVPLSNRWISVTADGRVIEPAAARAAGTDSNWERVAADPQKKPAPPLLFSLPSPQRY